jgi:hypothetical protein
MFRRRLGNYLIKQMWQAQHQPADLATYIGNRRQEEEPIPSPKPQEQPLTFEVREQPFEQEVMEREERVLNPQEILELTEEMVFEDSQKRKQPPAPEPIQALSPPRERPSRSWISPLLRKHSATIQDSFTALDFRGNQALAKDQVKDLFREALGICEIELNPLYLDSFGTLADEQCGSRTKVSFQAFLSLMEDWALRTPVKSADFAGQLRRTIQEYEEMIESLGGPGPATRSVETLVETLRGQLKAYLAKKEGSKGGKSLESVQADALAELFSTYAKQIRLIGTTPTFDEITANNNQWTVGKFFKFCSDKDLMGKQTATKRRLSKDEVMLIFKKTAALTRNMELTHFKAALDELATVYYDEKYDEIMAGQRGEGYKPVAEVSLEEKRKRLYKELKLGDGGEGAKTAAHTGRKQSFDPPAAINRSEDPIRRPRFRLPKDTKAKLDEIKMQKQAKSVDPRPPKPVAKPVDLAALPMRGQQQGYSQRHVAKNVSAEPLSWQNLSKMHPSELASEEDMRNVIGEDDDDSPVSGNRISKEMREKAKRLGPQVQARDDARLDQAMRQLDRKMESGYKALKRSKAP